MERSFYKKHNSNFFKGKKARLTTTIETNGGVIFKKGSIIIINGKSRSMTKSGFEIRKLRLKKVTKDGCTFTLGYCRNVNPSDLELI